MSLNINALAQVPFAPRYARRYLVSTTDHVASGVAAGVLERGGNAADAAVAAAAALAVVAQHQCGMGGDAFALIRDPSGGVHALDAAGRAGSGADPGRAREEGLTRLPLRLDVRSATLPGAVAGWCALHERFGTWDLGDLLAPAIELAEGGFAASPTLVRDARAVTGIEANPEFGGLRRPGQTVVRPGIALALRELALGGSTGFYTGRFGEGLLALGAGEFSERDLQVAASWTAPLVLDAFGARLWTSPPVSQGYLVLASAAIVDRLAVPADPADPAWAHGLIEAARLAAVDRDDVLHEGADGRGLLDPKVLAERAARFDPTRRTSFRERMRDGDTNYFCIVDGDGMAVSFVHSNAHGFGSHLVVPGTGVFLHDRGIGFSLVPGSPSEYGPGRQPPHTLAPLVVTDGAGDLVAVLGTMGADAQPQVLLQLLHRLLVVGEDPATALSAARWFLSGPGTEHEPFDTWLVPGGAAVNLEAHAPEAWTEGLLARGHDVRGVEAFTVLAGYAQAIVRRDGALLGAADPRALSGSTLGR